MSGAYKIVAKSLKFSTSKLRPHFLSMPKVRALG